MLDIHFIRENRDKVLHAIRVKGVQVDLDLLLTLDTRHRALLQEVEAWRAERNEMSKRIAEVSGDEKTPLIEKMRSRKEAMAAKEDEMQKIEGQLHELLLRTPNIPWSGSPVGTDASANTEIRREGTPPQFSFTPKDHIELGTSLDIIDFEAGVKISGFRGYVLKNDGALLHWALLMHAVQKMVARGFTLLVPPTIIRSFALEGSGHFPFGRKEVFDLRRASHDENEKEGELLHLAGTSEPALLATHADAIIPEKNLPVKLAALTPCYRSEIGAYGKDTKGLYRVHEFMKVEQIVICKPDPQEAQAWFETMLGIAEEMLRDLELSYRLIETSTGDMGAGKYRMIDVETWMPSRDTYGETHSNSNLTDWQSRRLNMRFKDSSGELRFPYTLNNTVIASPRILIAILENHQQEDGSVKIPKVLQPFVGKTVLEPKR